MVSFDHHLITYAYPVPLIDTPKKQNKILMIWLVTYWVYLKLDFRVVPRISWKMGLKSSIWTKLFFITCKMFWVNICGFFNLPYNPQLPKRAFPKSGFTFKLDTRCVTNRRSNNNGDVQTYNKHLAMTLRWILGPVHVDPSNFWDDIPQIPLQGWVIC